MPSIFTPLLSQFTAGQDRRNARAAGKAGDFSFFSAGEQRQLARQLFGTKTVDSSGGTTQSVLDNLTQQDLVGNQDPVLNKPLITFGDDLGKIFASGNIGQNAPDRLRKALLGVLGPGDFTVDLPFLQGLDLSSFERDTQRTLIQRLLDIGGGGTGKGNITASLGSDLTSTLNDQGQTRLANLLLRLSTNQNLGLQKAIFGRVLSPQEISGNPNADIGLSQIQALLDASTGDNKFLNPGVVQFLQDVLSGNFNQVTNTDNGGTGNQGNGDNTGSGSTGSGSTGSLGGDTIAPNSVDSVSVVNSILSGTAKPAQVIIDTLNPGPNQDVPNTDTKSSVLNASGTADTNNELVQVLSKFAADRLLSGDFGIPADVLQANVDQLTEASAIARRRAAQTAASQLNVSGNVGSGRHAKFLSNLASGSETNLLNALTGLQISAAQFAIQDRAAAEQNATNAIGALTNRDTGLADIRLREILGSAGIDLQDLLGRGTLGVQQQDQALRKVLGLGGLGIEQGKLDLAREGTFFQQGLQEFLLNLFLTTGLNPQIG